MKQKLIFSLFVISALIALMAMAVPAAAGSGQPQIVYQTPTALPDGRVIYKVKENDTCISISLLNKISLDDLRRLNGLQGGDCFLRVGQDLLLGVVAATQGPAVTPTPTSLIPAGTPFNGNGEICIFLFNDINGNGLAEDGEPAVAGGAASITDRIGKVSLTGQTDGSGNPTCFKDVPSGDYNISLAVPDGYNATTALKYTLNLRPGDISTLDFGAQISSAAKPVPVSEGGRSPMLGILGGLLVLAGAGLGIYFRSIRR